ncbi:hypothetical protein ACWKW6_31785 [Dyadobacter jiangsuensis]
MNFNMALNQYNYLCIEKYKFLCAGLTFEHDDLRVLDAQLEMFDKKTGIVTYIIQSNIKHGYQYDLEIFGPQYIVKVEKYLKEGKNLAVSYVGQQMNQIDLPPSVHFILHSPSMDIPQRVEIPLRYLVKGGPSLRGTFMVYLHVLQINNEKELVYYGITRRGWMKRLIEHLKLAMKKQTERKFPKALGDAISGRYSVIGLGHGRVELEEKQLTASYHVVCAAGRSKDNAFQIESYLIGKYGLSKESGLNMIGGHKAIMEDLGKSHYLDKDISQTSSKSDK